MLKTTLIFLNMLFPFTMGAAFLESPFEKIGKEERVSPKLLKSVCKVETNLRIKAFNRKDGKSPSYGICQVKKIAAKHIKLWTNEKDIMKPENNIRVAARYLRYQLDRYNGNVVKALSAYNAGRDISQNTYAEKVFSAYLAENIR